MQVLGKHGIICMEDLVHEIHTCGPAFKQVKTLKAVSAHCAQGSLQALERLYQMACCLTGEPLVAAYWCELGVHAAAECAFYG